MITSAHEEQNIQYPSDEYLWTYSKDIGHNEVFEWDFSAEAVGYQDRKGIIRIEVLEHLYEVNLLEFLEQNSTAVLENDTLEIYQQQVNQLFDMQFDDNIAYFDEVYPVDYFIVPIMFKSSDNDIINMFRTNFNRNQFFMSLVNDTIDNSCIQGCHQEEVSPFESTSSTHRYQDNQLIIEGTFRVRDFPGSITYNYDGGDFIARYDVEKGILVSWNWQSDDGTSILDIELRDFTQQEIIIFAVLGSIFLMVVAIAVWIFVKPRFRTN